ncbi:SOS response-associated peptidase [Paenibacillus oenotherae]|uniref:Abasic site processing protein n=1 Tax=Paenibacillus oenotherae TaxID=1435645 RepID=A0ABS7D2I8_9BACL|nr:SOS response-associated peptidase [Paenibacillus oenotherae]MBW7474149.1 SOS response-associated peptidase [Paenibacillus oenotherae]
MCGRYTITISIEELMLRYLIGEVSIPFQRPRYNVAPTQKVYAVVNDGHANRLGLLQWGLIPAWAKDASYGSKMLNARAETVWSKPAFEGLVRRKRCIIPADGFYEWKKTSTGKQPMRIALRTREVFSMAGLYDTWTMPDGSKLSTCTIITTEPNELMAPIHNRMPVILKREDEAAWLDRSTQDQETLGKLLVPYAAAAELEAYPVSPKVGYVANDDPSCIAPFEE